MSATIEPTAATNYQPTSEDLARHECGHVVAAMALGAPVIKVEIGDLGEATTPGATIHGRTTAGEAGLVTPGIVVATALWCGPLAECIGHADVPLGVILAVTGSGDMELLRRIYPPWVTDSSPGSPFQRARELVLDNADAIATLTALLVERRELSGDEIHAAITVTKWS